MTARPPRDCRADARTALTRWLRHTNAPNPDALAGELLVVLDGARLGLVDLTPPEDPNADWRPPAQTTPAAAETPGTSAYQAARAALRGTTTQDGQP